MAGNNYTIIVDSTSVFAQMKWRAKKYILYEPDKLKFAYILY